MITATRIAELEQQLAAAQEQAQTNFSLLTGVRTELATTVEGRDQALSDLNTRTQERDTAVGERDTAMRELATERESRETLIRTQVDQRLNAAGIDPIKRDPAAADTPAAKPSSKAGTPAQRLAAGFTVPGQ